MMEQVSVTPLNPSPQDGSWVAALNIVVHKPHSVDKRLAGQVELEVWTGAIEGGSLPVQTIDKIHQLLKERKQDILTKVLGEAKVEDSEQETVTVRLQRMVGRNLERVASFHQVVIISGTRAEWHPLGSEDSVAFMVELSREESGDKVVASMVPGAGKMQRRWVTDRLVGRLVRWSLEQVGGGDSASLGSLRLVGLEEYTSEYLRLKEKYAQQIISHWKETSDPEKFVHEDIGISAYLLLLWRQQRVRTGRDELQTFVDLGCGNGLLVYLLTMEGHQGVGYDLRRRAIWDWFPSTVDLREEVVRPAISTVFPGVDWVLGNHSDELTPWVSVIAALSSPTTSYWVLPCCPHSFINKYQRRNAAKSVWRDYLDWLIELGLEAGFDLEEDRMRIPSTKRVCLVGQPREGSVLGYHARKVEVEQIVSRWAEGFTPRAKVERVRNCSQVDRGLVSDIVRRVVGLCLEEASQVEVGGKSWNRGATLPLATVVESLLKSGVELTKLKAECGGLQTLLKNHQHIFFVQGGTVRIRRPDKDVRRNTTGIKLRSKPCWHFHSHPDGCTLSASECSWSHPPTGIVSET